MGGAAPFFALCNLVSLLHKEIIGFREKIIRPEKVTNVSAGYGLFYSRLLKKLQLRAGLAKSDYQ